MTDYEVGWGKPPKHTQFKKGVSGNPIGRRKRELDATANIITDFMNETVTYRERGRVKKAPRVELRIRALVSRAIKGDITAAAELLKLRDRAERFGDVSDAVVYIKDWLPDYPGQTAEQKTRDASMQKTETQVGWWESKLKAPGKIE